MCSRAFCYKSSSVTYVYVYNVSHNFLLNIFLSNSVIDDLLQYGTRIHSQFQCWNNSVPAMNIPVCTAV